MPTTPPTTPLTYNGYVHQMATMAVVGTTVVGGQSVSAGSFVVGNTYVITFIGTTDFTLIGASSNIVGLTFTATGAGSGTGTATYGGVVAGVDPEFNAIVPQMLNYAELRIQRDLDLQNLTVTNVAYNLTLGNSVLSVDVNDFVTIETVGIISGTNTTPVLPVTKEYIQNVYSDTSYRGLPIVFAMYSGDSATAGSTSMNLLFGPCPDNAYNVSLTGLSRMPTLYKYATPALADTEYTLISLYMPDLLIMASMVYISAYQRNFGRLNDDPQMAITYESQYQTLLRGALGEEYRKKFEGADWSAYSASPVAVSTVAKG